MKRSYFVLSAMICACTACAQTSSKPAASSSAPASPPSSPTPSVTSTGLKVRGPEAVAQQQPDKVVATIAGKPITAKQALDMIKPLGPQERARYQDKLPELIQQLYMEGEVSQEAAKMNLDQQSPWKDQLKFARQNILTQAYLDKMANANGGAATDPKQYYDTHPEDFDQATVSGIVVSFSPPGTPAGSPNNARTEAQAQEKATEIEKKVKAGTDFSALARTDSDDQRSSVKGGEMGQVTMGDPNVPAPIKNAIEKLKAGEVSEPVRANGALYIFKVNSRTKVPFEQVQAAIKQKVQGDRSKIVLQQELAKYKVDVQDQDFFNASNAALGGPKPPPSLARPATASPQPPSKP